MATLTPTTARIFDLIMGATEWTWLEVAAWLDGGDVETAQLRSEFAIRVDPRKTVQDNVNHLCKKATDTEDHHIIPFIQNIPKKHVNCLGVTFITLLVSGVLHQKVEMYASESHTWAEAANGERLDFKGNLAFAKRAKRPLSIYAPAILCTRQEKCILLLTNKSRLADAELAPLLLALHQQGLMEQPWGVAKLLTMDEYLPAAVISQLLAAQPDSLQCALTAAFYYLDHADMPAAVAQAHHALQLQDIRNDRWEPVDNDIFTVNFKDFMAALLTRCHTHPFAAAEATYNAVTTALWAVAARGIPRDADYKDYVVVLGRGMGNAALCKFFRVRARPLAGVAHISPRAGFVRPGVVPAVRRPDGG
jgi:hypothetical protein